MARFALVSHHLRHASRLLLRHRGTSLLAILALGSGIGLTATAFSLVDGLLLRGLPFEHGERYVYVASDDVKRAVPRFRMTPRDYADLRDGQSSFEAFVPFTYQSVNLSDEADYPERRNGCFISHELFASPSFEPLLGRGFTAEDDVPGARGVVVIGHDLWRQRFAGDPDVLGREIRVDGQEAEVIGVMPPRFRFPLREEVWLPLRLDPSRFARDEGPPVRLFGRLRRGVSLEEARAELATVAERLARDHPETHAGRGIYMVPFTRHFMWPTMRHSLWALLAMVGLGLLTACANVATLLLARAAGRLRDLATFTALGASRARVMSYVMSESLLLAFLSALAGLLFAVAGVRVMATQMSWMDLPFWMVVTLDQRVLLFAVLLTVLTAQVAGLYPAWRASRADVMAFLQEARSAASLRAGRFLRTLVVAEVGFAFLLLVCTGLFLRTHLNLNRLDLGVDADRVFTAHMELVEADYPTPADRVALVQTLVANLSARPGVTAAGAMTSLPLWGYANQTPYALEGRAYATPADHPQTHRVAVTPEFFEVFKVGMFRGRALDSGDRAETLPVAVVNRSFAERAWPGEEAVGRRLRWARGDKDVPWMTVVGVVADLWPGTLDDPDHSGVYVPHAQAGDSFVALTVSTEGDAEPLGALLRRETQALDKSLPLFEARTLLAAMEIEMFHPRLFARLTTILGLVAVLLAAVGIYGVNVFSINQRTSEIGLRKAMGAERREIVGLILGQGLRWIALGLALGGTLAAFVTPFLKWLFFGTGSWDPVTFAATTFFLGAVALLACFAPAVRAARISPIEALRHE